MLKKSQLIALISVLMFYAFFGTRLYADSPATPEPEIEIFASLIINEVGFKNTEHDWIELYVIESGTIKGIKFYDDNDFLEITDNIMVEAGDFILLYFKADSDQVGYSEGMLTIQSTKSGLTGTTEQVVIKNNNDEIIDLICWRNSSPTSGEIVEFSGLINNQWAFSNIESCIDSDQILKTDSIGRKNYDDSNSPGDWKIFNIPTPGSTNIIDEEPEPIEEEPEVELPEIELPELVFEFEIPEPEVEIIVEECEPKIIEKIIEKEIKNICEDKIIISEFLPNPKGKDGGNEWIELKNIGDKKCNLDGWKVDDEEEGSKPYTIINEEINNNGYIILPSWKTKLNINNSEESIRLFKPDDNIADEVSFDKSFENETFAINPEGLFEWTTALTPLTTNMFIEIIEEEEEEEEIEKKETKKEKTSKIANGTLSDSILITEFLPNPKGTDKGNEWIEIYNDSDETVNLGNWKIDTGENTKVKYIFGANALEPHKHLLVEDGDLNISLKNSNGKVRLLDFKDQIIDEVEYESSVEDNSFAKVRIMNNGLSEFKWEWTEKITPGDENPTKQKYLGKILSFDENNSILSLEIEETNEKIDLNVLNDGASNFKQVFLEGTQIAAVTDGANFLENFEIISQPEAKPIEEKSNLLLYFLILTPLILGLGIFGLKKLGFKLPLRHNKV